MRISGLDWKIGSGVAGFIWIMMMSLGQAQGAADTFTVNLTNSANVNNPALRGFDPTVVTGPNDVFPDTSRPCCLEGSTMFGNGLPAGSSPESILQNCAQPDLSEPVVTPGQLREFGTNEIIAVPESASFPALSATTCDAQVTGNVFHNDLLFQQSKNGLYSRPQTDTTVCDDLGASANDRRCNEITFGFLQEIESQGQTMDLTFAIRSLTDPDGNLVGAAQGTFTQSITENNETRSCSGSFTFDEQNGFVMTSGPLHEC
jgi:hypothetical protein